MLGPRECGQKWGDVTMKGSTGRLHQLVTPLPIEFRKSLLKKNSVIVTFVNRSIAESYYADHLEIPAIRLIRACDTQMDAPQEY